MADIRERLKPLVVNRQELYRWIWSKPVGHVAAELRISGSALAKACRKHDIPTPPRGWWRKREAGMPCTQTPLPTPERHYALRFRVTEEAAARLTALTPAVPEQDLQRAADTKKPQRNPGKAPKEESARRAASCASTCASGGCVVDEPVPSQWMDQLTELDRVLRSLHEFIKPSNLAANAYITLRLSTTLPLRLNQDSHGSNRGDLDSVA